MYLHFNSLYSFPSPFLSVDTVLFPFSSSPKRSHSLFLCLIFPFLQSPLLESVPPLSIEITLLGIALHSASFASATYLGFYGTFSFVVNLCVRHFSFLFKQIND